MDRNTLAYVVGIAIGDGNLSNPNGRATRLRISCDTKYPALMVKIRDAVQEVMPDNKVAVQFRPSSNCADISCYSNQWEEMLGWEAGRGSKFIQNVRIPQWITDDKEYTIRCLRGLLETDGCIYNDRGYTMVMFTTIISDLAKDVCEMMQVLGFDPRLYKIERRTNPHNFNQKIIHHVRLSKNVQEFLDLIQPIKN
jgi:hypothetical protein